MMWRESLVVCWVDVEDTCPSFELPCIENRLAQCIGCGTQAKSCSLWQRKGCRVHRTHQVASLPEGGCEMSVYRVGW